MQKIKVEIMLFILHVKKAIFQLLNISFQKVQILRQEMLYIIKLHYILHVKIIKQKLSNYYYPKEQTKMSQIKMAKHHTI